MEDDIKSDYELLISSSKACAGVPYSFMNNITLEDYKAALIQNNELKSVSFNIIKNDKYINKTITVSKKILNTCCVKKYMKNERESYSFGYHKIPINFRHNFISDASISSNESNILENISNTSNISSNSISELSDLPLSSNNSSNILNTPIMSDESCVNIFKNREQKMIQKNIFPENNVISENENNTSNLELSDLCEIPQSSTSKIKKKTKKKQKKSNFIFNNTSSSTSSLESSSNMSKIPKPSTSRTKKLKKKKINLVLYYMKLKYQILLLIMKKMM